MCAESSWLPDNVGRAGLATLCCRWWVGSIAAGHVCCCRVFEVQEHRSTEVNVLCWPKLSGVVICWVVVEVGVWVGVEVNQIPTVHFAALVICSTGSFTVTGSSKVIRNQWSQMTWNYLFCNLCVFITDTDAELEFSTYYLPYNAIFSSIFVGYLWNFHTFSLRWIWWGT